MQTDFHAIFRHNARELSREDIEKMSWDVARAYCYANKEKWRASRPRDTRQTVCFTGFTASEKDALIKIAESRTLRVVQSVTTDLQFLVCGPNAGPKKLEKATAQGVAIMSEEDFKAYDA
jgi:NAD-dependent DNA ligase